jgi:hypothetical protein
MKNVGRSLTDVTALLLEPDERDAVLGDLAEADASASRSLLEVAGLVARRQLALWVSWRPWLAAFGVSLPGSLLLMGASLSVSCTYQRLTGTAMFGACAPTGHEGILLLLCHILLLLTWAWTGGFVVGSVSRRTLWVSVALCLSPCLYCLSRFHQSSVSALCLLLFLPPALLGVRYGLRMIRIRSDVAVTLAMVATALMICAWGNKALWALNWTLLVPAWYIAFAAIVVGSPGHGQRA